MRLLICAAFMCLWCPLALAECFATADNSASKVAGGDGFASLSLSDGREVRLADVVPAHALGKGQNGRMWERWSAESVFVARAAGEREADRYGRILGDLLTGPNRRSLLMQLLSEGLALVDPTVMSQACLDAMFTVERAAEQQRRGIWRRAPVRMADDATLSGAAGRYALVEGVVKSIGQTRRTVYLNFGVNYRTDFTVLVRRRKGEAWRDGLSALEGRRVRVRGVLGAWNGGLIEVEHPRQIETLDRPRAPLVRTKEPKTR
ncbi:MAG: thermonuclease family protein [Pseudomonadota bacterium]